MIQQAFVEIAEAVARGAHAGQFDKSGADYITHPARVAERVRRQGGADEAVAAAWLHDVLEDCDVSSTDLAAAGIPGTVIAAVQAVTKMRRRSARGLLRPRPCEPHRPAGQARGHR